MTLLDQDVAYARVGILKISIACFLLKRNKYFIVISHYHVLFRMWQSLRSNKRILSFLWTQDDGKNRGFLPEKLQKRYKMS